MSFITTLETIGKDIETGIGIAEPIVAAFVPALGPILLEISNIINELEGLALPSGTTINLSALTQSVAHVSTVKQYMALAQKKAA